MKHYLIPVLLIAYMIPFHSYSQWEWQNPLPQGNNLSWIQFVNPNMGFAVGDKGTIMKTTDKGLTWEQIYTGIWPDLTGIYFVNEMVGYAVSTDKNALVGYCHKTVDGGETWTELPFLFPDQGLCIWFLDENIGFVGTFSGVFKTSDGGSTWVHSASSGVTYWSIFFTDSLTGYLGGMDRIYKTTDCGNTWNVCYHDPDAVHLLLYFPTHDTGFAVDHNGIILKTMDGGLSWTRSTVAEGLFSVFFSSPQTGIITGTQHIYRTTDGGATWESQPVPVSDFLLAGAHADAQNAIVVGSHGATIITNDAGISWEIKSSYVTTDRLESLFFTSKETGYTTGNSGTILKTENGGESWQPCNSGTNNTLNCLSFTSPEVGYACGYNNAIVKTTDGGTNWFSIYSSSDPHYFNCIQFPSQNIGYCLYDGLLKSIDAGASWNEVAPAGNSNNSMFFTSSDTGYLCGNAGEIRRTTDGGNTFINLNSGVTTNLRRLYFVSKNTGFAIGNNLILKTNDGGDKWQTAYTGSFRPWGYNNINFSDPLHGFFVCWDTILVTKDGGETFQATSTGTYYMYLVDAIWFTDSLTGYITGDNGSILKTTTGGVITSIKKTLEVGNIIVFPNPNYGKFYIDLKEDTDGELEIYSLNGKSIFKTELKGHSRYSMINLNYCSLGIYILKIRAQNRILTGKVVIMNH